MSRKKKEAYLRYLKILLIVLLVTGLVVVLIVSYLRKDKEKIDDENKQSDKNIEKLEPKVHFLDKVWVTGNDETVITIIYKNRTITLFKNGVEFDQRQVLADVSMTEGKILSITPYEERINGKLLSVGDDYIELEGKGKLPYEEKLQVYKLYGEQETYGISDLRIGYDFADFVVDDGKVIGALVTREEEMENIRVAIKTTDFANIYHEKIVFSVDTPFILHTNEGEKEYASGEKIELSADSELFTSSRIVVMPSALTARTTIYSISRGNGTPSYRGNIEIEKTEQGLVIVNELLLEEYLYSVVPSEMPSNYPIEALKAQAVCARTYAYRHMLQSGMRLFGAHVDDSTSYQVYNNISESDQALEAVRETQGQLALLEGKPVDTYFYSTSCGYGTDMGAWKKKVTDADKYLKSRHISSEEYEGLLIDEAVSVDSIPQDAIDQQSEGEDHTLQQDIKDEDTFGAHILSRNSNDFESSEGWYRWKYESDLDEDVLLEQLKSRYAAKPDQVLTKTSDGKFISKEVKKLGKVTNIEVLERGSGGVISALLIEGTKKTYKILSENTIRYVLVNLGKEVLRQTGDNVKVSTLLPSAFFVISLEKEDDEVIHFRIDGGGYGHGIGMSQNAAKAMAEYGCTYDQIVSFFYDGVIVESENNTSDEG